MSYANMIMYSSVLPSYGSDKKEDQENSKSGKKGININTREGYLKMLEMTE